MEVCHDRMCLIITHNRPTTLTRSLDSVIAQDFENFFIVVSDNSDNDETRNIMQKYLLNSNSRISYMHHDDVPSGIDHFNKVLSNNTFDYFMMFHDDDEMLPQMVGTLYNAIKNEPYVSAVAPDLFYNENGQYSNRRMVKYDAIKYYDSKELAKEFTKLCWPGFPSYMYRAEKMKGIYMNPKEGGKYCDVSFLIKVAAKGYVKYIPEPLMYYYITSGQDSAKHEYSQYLLLFNFLKRYVERKEDLIPMRLRNIYAHMIAIQNERGRIPYKKVILYYFMHYSFKDFFFKYILRLLGYGYSKNRKQM